MSRAPLGYALSENGAPLGHALPRPDAPRYLVGGAVLFALAWNAWRLCEPLGRDQAIFYTLGRRMWAGQLPYRDLFEHKPPGIILVYAVAALLDRGATWGPALFDAMAAAGTAGLMVWGLRGELGLRGALAAAVLYSLSVRAPCFGGFWAIAQPECFQDLAVALAVVAGARDRWRWAGVALAAVLLLKFTYLLLVPVFILWARRQGSRAVLRLLSGLFLPGAALLVVTLATGVLGPMWDAVIVFNRHHAGVHLPWGRLPGVAYQDLLSLAIAAPGVVVLPLLAVLGPHRQRIVVLAAAVLAAALFQFLIQMKLWTWHGMPAVLPLAVLAGVGLGRLPGRAAGIGLAVMALLTAAGAVKEVAHRRVLGLLSGRLPRETFLSGYTWNGRDFSAVEVDAVGALLAQKARPGDGLLVWGFEPGVYVRSGLRPATRFLYDYPLTVGLPRPERDQAVAGVIAALPSTRWVAIFRHDENALETEDSLTELHHLPALAAALHAAYRLVGPAVGQVHDVLILQRSDSTAPTDAVGAGSW